MFRYRKTKVQFCSGVVHTLSGSHRSPGHTDADVPSARDMAGRVTSTITTVLSMDWEENIPSFHNFSACKTPSPRTLGSPIPMAPEGPGKVLPSCVWVPGEVHVGSSSGPQIPEVFKFLIWIWNTTNLHVILRQGPHSSSLYNFCICASEVSTAEALPLVSESFFLSTALCPALAEVTPSSVSSPDMQSSSPMDSGHGDSTSSFQYYSLSFHPFHRYTYSIYYLSGSDSSVGTRWSPAQMQDIDKYDQENRQMK